MAVLSCLGQNFWQNHCRTVFKIQAIFVFCNFCEKFENSNWLHFWRDKMFLKIGSATWQSYPMGKKFCRNCSI